MKCLTIKKRDNDAPGGFVIVNIEDFDSGVDDEFDGEVAAASGPVDYDAMTKDELASILNERDIDFSLSLKKGELISLLTEDDEENKE